MPILTMKKCDRALEDFREDAKDAKQKTMK